MKSGLEMNIFKSWKNTVLIYKVDKAVQTLFALKSMMDERFEFLRKNELTQINPVEHKMDRVFILIDIIYFFELSISLYNFARLY